MSRMRIGLSAVNITPPAGLPLMGNFRDDYAARGVHDPLWARAIVFADAEDRKASLLSVDSCMLDRHVVTFLREAIGSECDVPPHDVLIHATHTHSAPAACGMLGMADLIAPHAAPIEAMLRKAASTVVEANARLQEADLEVGHASERRISFNRRLRRRDRTTQMNWEALQPGFDPSEIEGAWGPIDPEIVCLAMRPVAGPIAALVNFGLHPAILAGDNWLYSADYPGAMIEALSRTLDAHSASGNGATCVFLNGCCGDVNHVDYRDSSRGRGYAMTEHVGTLLAERAWQAIGTGDVIPVNCVRVSRQQVELQRLKISQREHDWCERVLEQARERPPQGQVDGLPDAYFARLRLEMWHLQHQPDFAEVMVIRLGDAAIVGLPGEVFCELGLEIKRRSPAPHTLVASLCDDAIGYLPTRDAFAQGGYETMVGSTFYKPDSGQRLVDSAVGQLQRLFATTDSE